MSIIWPWEQEALTTPPTQEIPVPEETPGLTQTALQTICLFLQQGEQEVLLGFVLAFGRWFGVLVLETLVVDLGPSYYHYCLQSWLKGVLVGLDGITYH